MNGHGIAFQDFRSFLGSAGTFFFNDYLVDAKREGDGVGERDEGERKKKLG